MSTLADDDIPERLSAAPPVSAHPAFPAIVASWFAALLGLGSLILPVALLGRLTAAVGIAALIPSAAAPLGFTARTTIAIAAAFLGAVLGLALARGVARRHAPRHRTRFSEDGASPCRPISAHDELGEEGLVSEETSTTGTRRRRLAIAGDGAPNLYLNHVSLPGQGHPPGEQVVEAIHLDFAEPDGPRGAQDDQEVDMSDEPNLEPGPPASVEPELEEAASMGLAAVDKGYSLDGADLPAEERPLDQLGLVQLVARLGSAIERRRELCGSADAARPAPTGVVYRPAPLGGINFGEDDDSEIDDLCASFSLPLRIRSGTDLEPVGQGNGEYDEEEEDPTADEAYSSLLTMKSPLLKTGEFVPIEEPEPDEGEVEATRYFPELGRATAPAPPAIDSSPQAAAHREAGPAGKQGDARRELRAALDTLQRMSGAA